MNRDLRNLQVVQIPELVRQLRDTHNRLRRQTMEGWLSFCLVILTVACFRISWKGRYMPTILF